MTLDYKELKKEFKKKEKEIRRREDVGISESEEERTPPSKPTKRSKKETEREYRKQILWEYLVGK